MWPSGPGLVSWLRARTHPGLFTPGFEAVLARRWLGGDPFGLRELPAAPGFLAGVPVSGLPAQRVAPLLRRISLTRPAPAAAEVSGPALDADRGPVSVAVRGRRLRRWGQPAGWGAPLLPRTTRIPHVVHGIWLGKPMPASSVFWRNYAAAARRYAGQVDFVVWTDIPRQRFAEALAQPAPAGQADPLAEVRALLDWAREHGILLVNVFEVFHAQAPMRLHAQFVLEMCKQLPRGFASASDHLRVEIVHRFGGLYADGDMIFVPDPGRPPPETLPQFFDRLARSTPAFTMNPAPDGRVGADMLAAPARHPAIALWLECARLNYFWNQPDMFGGLRMMAMPYVGYPWQEHRYLAPHRTGRIHYQVLALLGMNHRQLPAIAPAVETGRELSWLPPAGGEPAAAARLGTQDQPDAPDRVVGVLARCLTFLQWQLLARDGNLYLSAVDPVIRGLPDPDAAWTALLSALPAVSAGLPAVTSVTDLRRNDDGRLEAVLLPSEAEALLDRTTPPAGWLGAPLSPQAEPVWLLEERVAPATLHTPTPHTPTRRTPTRPRPAADPPHRVTALAEVAVDAVGHPIGVWLRSPRDADRWRRHPRFTALPADHFGVHLGTPHPDTLPELALHPETIAALLLHLQATGQPIQLTVPPDTLGPAGPLATRLQHLLGQPVQLTEPPTTNHTPATALHPQLPPIHHHPLTKFREQIAAARIAG